MASPLSWIKRRWRLLIIILTPLILLPIPLLGNSIRARCGYIILLLTIYWVSEAMPYAVTSLLPLAFFPMAGVLKADRVGSAYFKDITTLFVGSMTLAYAMEHVSLHKRVALLVLSVVGSSTKWTMAGLMCVTAFLSMWINNSAATSVMIPAAIAIINELQTHQENYAKDKELNNNTEIMPQHVETYYIYRPLAKQSLSKKLSNDKDQKSNEVDYERLKTGFLIAVAYSAAVGGLATLVGTGPNIFVKGFVDDYYTTGPFVFQITFANFLLYALPIGIIILIQWKTDPKVLEAQAHLKNVLKQQYKELGSLNWKEANIAVLFIVIVVLWITKDFSNTPGWDILFREKYVTDGTAALLIGFLPLIIPDSNPFQTDWKYNPILQWSVLSKMFPWGVFMLQGAGLSIADAFKESGLSDTIAELLQFVTGAPQTLIIFIVIIISALFTEFTSNLAAASILFPILASIAKISNIHPAYLILPCAMSVSLSFMLPIATPPNAMIFSGGNVRIIDMNQYKTKSDARLSTYA
ncbi:unnamed protein product [Didymodactylos carnosus]|uniref:Uncharacterized protein n=1 Tax=Didymodactylos carnosus TaxID=1234261 RepID=A0A814BM08_9BILA|nr:unnamed protein product [Didymodactylos carnosus]CAF1125497.1 unnamed protein product [Didymodactylos carnosus]CAF3707772.1 unnamed protein product [Didymodactylos carnosus]CAF3903124.1 unnamed protein product [Didymodactylos carnosus]